MTARKSRVLHRSLRETPPKAIGGDGVWLIAEDGRAVLDASGGAAVSCLGHQHPRVIEAMARQASKLAYAHTALLLVGAGRGAGRPCWSAHEPGGLAYAYFVSGGSEAIEAAIKLARQYFVERGEPQRQHFIARRQSYHGNTLGALAAGGNAWRREPYAPLLSSAFSHVTPAFAYHEKRDDETEADFVARLAAELEAEFQRLGPDTVAAFIAEPVVGATAGCVPAPDGYFRAVREICDRHGALLILDEVMCGMGRTGTHACLGAGRRRARHPGDRQGTRRRLPADRRDARERPASSTPSAHGSGAFQHGHTYLAHPLACAAALEVQRMIREEHLLDRVKELGKHLEQRLTERFGNHRHVGDIRGPRPVPGDRAGRRSRQPRAVRSRAQAQPEDQGGRVRGRAWPAIPAGGTVDGSRGDHVLLAPPYIATPDDIDMIVDRLGTAVDSALRSIGH